VAGFYAARDRIMPPLLWPSIAPPFTGPEASAKQDHRFVKKLVPSALSFMALRSAAATLSGIEVAG